MTAEEQLSASEDESDPSMNGFVLNKDNPSGKVADMAGLLADKFRTTRHRTSGDAGESQHPVQPVVHSIRPHEHGQLIRARIPEVNGNVDPHALPVLGMILLGLQQAVSASWRHAAEI